MKIYVFGNPLVSEDSLSLLMLPRLKKEFPEIKFEVVDPNENFPPSREMNLIILDSVKEINKVMLLDYSDLISVEKSPVSPHDYDLLLHLLLLKKMGKINEVKIIGVPYGAKQNEILNDVINIIQIIDPGSSPR